jgi:opacity protein-like surface antigen
MPDDRGHSMRAKGMKERPMRWVVCALVVLGFASPAVADDFGILRGSETVGPATFTRWSGFYVGGQIGYGDANADFSGATQAPIAYALRETYLENDIAPSQWPVLLSTTNGATSYGGFAGYNTQWQDLILGIEGNFNRAVFSLVAPSTPIARTATDSTGSTYALSVSGTGSMTTVDFATLRARAGWVVGNFLPYAFAGAALGVADTSVSASVSGVEYTSGSTSICTASQPCYPFSFTTNNSRNSELLYGFAVGGGLDVALTPNVFVRGEFEYVQFAPVSGIVAGIASARVGAGLKF